MSFGCVVWFVANLLYVVLCVLELHSLAGEINTVFNRLVAQRYCLLKMAMV